MSESRPRQDEAPSLSRTSFVVVLAISLAVFFGLNPSWTGLSLAEADANILWSYAPIPALVLGALALERKLAWSAFALETLRVTLVKFGITYLFANTMWAVFGPPAPEPHAPPVAAGAGAAVDPFLPREPPSPSSLDGLARREVGGRVVDASGAPAPDAFVWVEDGLEALVFEAPRDELVLTNDGSGFRPTPAIVRTFQPLSFASTDGALHTAFATNTRGEVLFNLPATPAGPRRSMLDRPLGVVRIGCRVHGALEPACDALVTSSPFAAVTKADGSFELGPVPDTDVVLGARHPELGRARLALPAGTEGTGSLRIVLEPR